MVRCDSFVRRQLAGAAGAALAAAPLDVAAPLLQKLAQPMLLDLRSQVLVHLKRITKFGD